MFNAARAEGRREPYEAYAFDAFIELARRAANPSPDPGAAAPEDTATAAPTPRPSPPNSEQTKTKATPARYLAIIRLDHTALRRGSVEGDEVCEIVGLGPIPVSVARKLLGDAILKLVITNGVDVMNVTHLGRSATVAQQVALWWQSPRLQGAGCTRTQRLAERPPLRMGQDQTHTARRARPALQTPPRPQDPRQLGPHRTAKDHDQWSHPTTPATPGTDHHHDACLGAIATSRMSGVEPRRHLAGTSELGAHDRDPPVGSAAGDRKPPDLTDRSRGSLDP